MLKKISHLFLSLVLSISILAPSVYLLFSSETEIVVLMDTSEKEKEGKSEIDLEEKILQDLASSANLEQMIPKKTSSTYYLETQSSHLADVLDPPPERIA